MKLRILVDDKTYEVDAEVADEPALHSQAFVVTPSVAVTLRAFTVDAGYAVEANQVVMEFE